ncbi:M48 family metalloprotease [Nostoc piscinale]|uniref:M48 family metalloprotease n=1 Tax=Nostoc piscinale TaxID=224012 RepID=UPI000782458B
MGDFQPAPTGLLKAADNEAQLASVIAHEIGHIPSCQAINQMRKTAITRGIATATGLDSSTAVQIWIWP